VFNKSSSDTIKSVLFSIIEIHKTLRGAVTSLGIASKYFRYFDYSANHNDLEISLNGKYWKGVYLSEGFGTPINISEAKTLFEEVAENNLENNHYRFEAWFRYMILSEDHDENMTKKFIDYLESVAEKEESATAFYTLSLTYYTDQKFKDEEKGRRYLIIAAQKGNEDAIKKCEEYDIKYLNP
jgi:TPR repeat protein